MKLKFGVIAVMAACSMGSVQANENIVGVGGVITPDIVGGSPANTAEWGFYTQIVGRNSNRSFCGGSYLGDGYVLTAAHCVDTDLPSQLAVKVGGFRYNGTDGERANVTNIYVHPNFNSRNLANDIAILKLDRVISNDKRVEIAAGGLSQYAVTGDQLSVAGLGRLSEGGSTPSVLMAVDVPLVSDAQCRTAGGSYANVGPVSFCAGVPQGGIDSCQGDSGGPIVVNRGGVVTQLGIVSWGIGCARPGKYGVYSDIAALRDWVDSVVVLNADNVSVGYNANQPVTAFELGQTASHTFSVKNTGNVPFTVTQTSVSASGVAQNALISQDGCRASTLPAGQSCQVAVEFSASATGTASVALTFEIDKTNTQYVAKASAQVTSASQPGTCETEWNAGAVYNTGDVVSWQGQLWEAQWWNQGADPSQSGPWGVWQAIAAGHCGGGSPTPEPTPDPTPEPTPDPEPTPPASGNAYVAGTAYSPGDVVTQNGGTYQCRAWPNGLWCASSAYEPGVGDAWSNAWAKL